MSKFKKVAKGLGGVVFMALMTPEARRAELIIARVVFYAVAGYFGYEVAE